MPKKSRPETSPCRHLSLTLILLLGVVSLCGDIVSNGARSVTGPYLLILGGNAAIVGLVAGLGEFIGNGLRVFTGLFADHSRSYWGIVTFGYALLIAIPFLALVGHWEIAAILLIAERVGKAIRTPPRDTLLSLASTHVGRGWGFGIHKSLDQVGAIIGPLLFTAAFLLGGGYREGFALLAIPLALTFITLFYARSKVPLPLTLDREKDNGPVMPGKKSSRLLIAFGAFVCITTVGFANFPLISYHLKFQSIVPDVEIPLFYAVAMLAASITALGMGRAYDRFGTGTMILMPAISLGVAMMVFSTETLIVLIGSALWGMGIGLYELVIRVAIADFTPLEKRGMVYGMIYAVYGTAWFVGSVVIGILYDISISHIIGFVAICEILAFIAFFRMQSRLRESGISTPHRL